MRDNLLNKVSSVGTVHGHRSVSLAAGLGTPLDNANCTTSMAIKLLEGRQRTKYAEKV